MRDQPASPPDLTTGTVLAVRGAVVDVAFDGHLPAINDALTIDRDAGGLLTLEVQSHLDPQTVRAVAFQAT
ncbi:MAG: F0F1 ATP synthase subunit beta, partial [Alphaproteobacteria bacterium]|nr:F0F1 ATP synthase subunit beta [Alphaproteobacteria bacterium]